MKTVLIYRRVSGSCRRVEFTGSTSQLEAFSFIFNNQPITIEAIRMEGEAAPTIDVKDIYVGTDGLPSVREKTICHLTGDPCDCDSPILCSKGVVVTLKPKAR